MVIHLVNDDDDDDGCCGDGNGTAGTVVVVWWYWCPGDSLPFIIYHVFLHACDWTKCVKMG